MAFLKFGVPGQIAGEAAGNFSNSPAESVEVLRRRARHRLIGASVLVFVGVVGFPLVFDTQPRPVSVDIAVDIPDRVKTKPLVSASAATKQAPLATDSALSPKEEIVNATKKEEAAMQPSATAVVGSNVVPSVAPTKTSETPSTASATPVLDGPRFVVQIGAFADEAKVKEVRSKLEKAGLKTYTNVANTKDGPRTRVRVGPFTSKDEADKMASKIKQMQLQPQVLTL